MSRKTVIVSSTHHLPDVDSYTTIKDSTVSVGALGMVFVLQPSQDK